MDPVFLPTSVPYSGAEPAGTIIIDTGNRFLYLVQPGGWAIRYGVGVGRPGFEWAGVHNVTRKAEWPDWRPPAEMREREAHYLRLCGVDGSVSESRSDNLPKHVRSLPDTSTEIPRT